MENTTTLLQIIKDFAALNYPEKKFQFQSKIEGRKLKLKITNQDGSEVDMFTKRNICKIDDQYVSDQSILETDICITKENPSPGKFIAFSGIVRKTREYLNNFIYIY